MQVAARARRFLARRPWVYWLIVLALALAVAFGIRSRLAEVDSARDRWTTTRTVEVATADHRPGDPLSTRPVELPLAAVPPEAIGSPTPGARARQRIGTGEVVVSVDVVPPGGPAAGADPGTVVVPVADPLARGVRVGLAVRIAAEGATLAADGLVVEVVDDVAYVAVLPGEAPAVAAAAKTGSASILFLP